MSRYLLLAVLLSACAGAAPLPEQKLEQEEAEAPAAAIDPHAAAGAALLHGQRFDEAIAAFDRALARDPRNIGVRYMRSFALFQRGDVDEADVAIAALLAELPADHELRADLLCARALHADRQDREDDGIRFRIEACAADESSCCP